MVGMLGRLHQLCAQPPVNKRFFVGVLSPSVRGICKVWSKQGFLEIIQVPGEMGTGILSINFTQLLTRAGSGRKVADVSLSPSIAIHTDKRVLYTCVT
jgi:hypothetical protein